MMLMQMQMPLPLPLPLLPLPQQRNHAAGWRYLHRCLFLASLRALWRRRLVVRPPTSLTRESGLADAAAVGAAQAARGAAARTHRQLGGRAAVGARKAHVAVAPAVCLAAAVASAVVQACIGDGTGARRARKAGIASAPAVLAAQAVPRARGRAVRLDHLVAQVAGETGVAFGNAACAVARSTGVAHADLAELAAQAVRAAARSICARAAVEAGTVCRHPRAGSVLAPLARESLIAGTEPVDAHAAQTVSVSAAFEAGQGGRQEEQHRSPQPGHSGNGALAAQE